jgi:glycosyltransferase involved in cell wall biosynthesis
MFDVTLVIPMRNEAAFLARTLETLAAQEMGPFRAEVLLVDGRSEDGTREVAEPYTRRAAGPVVFRLLDNPERRTPFAFNLGIRESKAPVIGFGGSHTDYPPQYLRRAVELLASTDADVVGGGHDRIIPGADGVVASAMSCLYLSAMGAGVAAYHRRRTPGYVDTVYGGFYRRQVFDRVGGFNPALIRNQDNELNARVTAAGFRILFHPDLSTSYVQKTDLRVFLSRGFLFGRFHPSTWRANPKAFRWRHAVPALLVLYLAALLGFLLRGAPPPWTLVPLALYVALLAGAGLRLAWLRSPLVGALAIGFFFLYHVSYGLGVLSGLATSTR